MTNHREETGYTHIKPDKKRVPISQYGVKAEAERARAAIKKLIESKQLERE